MRENDSIVRKDRPTVRIGDRVRVCYHGKWVAAVIQGKILFHIRSIF